MKKILQTLTLTLIIIVAFVCVGKTQVTQMETRYLLLRIGTGTLYGSYGGNVEYRNNRFSANVMSGYKHSFSVDSLDINSTINFGGGVNYFYTNIKKSFRAKVGIYGGWLGNYYDEEIGTASYNPVVYGVAPTVGLEISEKYMYLDISFLLDPGYFIFNKASHPHYDRFHFSGAIGVGINLYDFKKLMVRKPVKQAVNNAKNKDKDFETNVKKENNEQRERDMLSTQLKNRCQDLSSMKINRAIMKGSCPGFYAYKQISNTQYLFIRMNLDDVSSERYCSILNLNDSTANVKVFLVRAAEMNDYVCEDMMTKNTFADEKINSQNMYVATEGKATIRLYTDNENQRATVQLRDIKLIKNINGNIEELYYDEVVICNVRVK